MSVVLIQQPEILVSGASFSRAVPVWNRPLFILQRQDFALVAAADSGGFTQVSILGDITAELTIGDTIYIELVGFSGTATISSFVFSNPNTDIVLSLAFDAGFVVITDKFINLVSARPDYRIETNLLNKSGGLIQFMGTLSPSNDGKVRSSPSTFLRSLVSPNTDFDYVAAFLTNTNASAFFKLQWRELFGATIGAFDVSEVYSGINSVLQFGDANGENMRDYTIKPLSGTPAKWLLHGEAQYSGKQTSLSFIAHDEATTLEWTEYKKDGSTVVNSVLLFNIGTDETVVQANFPTLATALSDLRSVGIVIKSGANVRTEEAVFLVKSSVSDETVHLRWENGLGGYSYFTFDCKSMSKVEVDRGERFKRAYESISQNQGYNRSMINAAAEQVSVFAQFVTRSQLAALRTLYNSVQVWELVEGNWNEVRILSGSTPPTRSDSPLLKMDLTFERGAIQTTGQ